MKQKLSTEDKKDKKINKKIYYTGSAGENK
jgi:hypothetical protein